MTKGTSVEGIVNTASLCAAFITLLAISIIGYFRRQILNRVTLRFQGLIAFIDIIKHITMFNFIQPDGPLCAFIGFFLFFLDHIYVFTNVLITLNVQLIYIHNILPSQILEVLYIVIAIGVAFVIDLIPFAYSAYGKTPNKFCFLKDPLKNRSVFKFFLIYASIIPCLVYCAIIFFWVVVSLYRKNEYLRVKFPSKNVTIFGEVINGRTFIKKLYFRLSLYPISSVVCFLPYISANLYKEINHDLPAWARSFYMICYNSAGTMNLISLLYDPHFQIAMKNIYENGFRKDPEVGNKYSLQELGEMKKEDEEYLVLFPGEESIRFEDFIKFL